MPLLPARAGLVLACVGALIASTACSGDANETPGRATALTAASPSATQPAPATDAGSGVHPVSRSARNARAVVDGAGGAPAPETETETEVDSGSRVGESAGLRGDSPYVWRVRASVSPTCVRAGETATLTVGTAPGAALGYVAVYAGDKSGAAPPFGYGYGGNAAGYADQSGGWTQTWTIRADAPVGPAKVTVVAGSHQTRKQVDAPFTVVDPVTGRC